MQTINVFDVVKRGFNRAIENIGLFLGAELTAAGVLMAGVAVLGVLALVVGKAAGLAMQFPLKQLTSPSGIWAGLFFVLIFVCFLIVINIITMGFLRLSLRVEDDQAARIGTLFESRHLVWRYIGVSFLYKLIVLGGFALFIIPGIIWGVQFGFATRVLVDRQTGIMAALRESSRITEGHKMNLFALSLILFILNGIGSALYGIGMLFVYPIALMIMATAYRKLTS